ncbi:unnamed protein product, partial [marine sediment metagenome]
NEEPRKQGRRRRILIVVGVMVACLVLVLVALHAYPTMQLERKMAAVRAAGQPTTRAELAAWYPTPPMVDNAALVYNRAFARYVAPTGEAEQRLPLVGSAELPERGEPLSPEMLAAVEEHLLLNRPFLDSLYEAAAMPTCQFPIDVMSLPAPSLPHLAQLRNAARCLQLDAIAAAERHQRQRAAGAVLAGFALAEAVATEPLLISQLVRIAMNGIAVAGLERV